MRKLGISRRGFAYALTGACGLTILRPARAADITLRQFHGQPDNSTLHARLVEMWAAIEKETGGRVHAEVHASNDAMPGGDPESFRMLQSGELDFFTLMGGMIGEAVPAVAVQGVPFAFRTPQQVYHALDGALGDYLRTEMEAKGIYALRRGCFENGMRQIGCTKRPVRTIEDMRGLRVRVPNGEIFKDFFTSLGAVPVGINSNRMLEALKAGTVDAQENPPSIFEVFRLYEVQKYLSMTNHMWSGFNLISNRKRWLALPGNVRSVIERNAAIYVAKQRADNDALNARSIRTLQERGMHVNQVDTKPFRARLSAFYGRWKAQCGSKAWGLLEETSGKLG